MSNRLCAFPPYFFKIIGEWNDSVCSYSSYHDNPWIPAVQRILDAVSDDREFRKTRYIPTKKTYV